ncbi:beta-ketoacyl synthase N-terminal-like domain-containing protein [Myxococcus sp. AM010]|uniref:beta-ketoacyl synthase N-terminal-like domain-containing protein n=1 Tax=Myxococcus sp. AM010 TaxID=2745138 RepID=UPI001594F162|nr:beta-ketoacyl synthase N-terminal-like domain-containing protein [Myxococcus sp. AM010]NVJ16895.1 hypothetical protein [Myxococcus sp. AM010]
MIARDLQSHSPAAIAITGLGLTSSLGIDVVASCASARAGVTQWTQLDIEEPDLDTLESIPLKGHSVRGLTDGFDGVARLARLGDAALDDLIRYSGLKQASHARMGFFLCLPGHFYSTSQCQFELLGQGPAAEDVAKEALRAHFERQKLFQSKLEQSLVPALLQWNGLDIPFELRTTFHGGPAVFARAVEQAVNLLRSRKIDRCIVGGIDSYVHGSALADAHTLGLLRTEEKPSGFFPGEAASFILLERMDAARLRGARIEGFLGSSAMAAEDFDRFSGVPPQGIALATATEECFRLEQRRPGLIIVNINGDEFRARDFGTALVRLRGTILPEESWQWFPPASFGEIGVATGAASICLAVRGFVRGYAPSHSAIVMLLGDDEARGAMFVGAPSTPVNRTRPYHGHA